MALTLATKQGFAGLNSGVTTVARQVRLEEIKINEEFASLFPVKPSTLEQIIERIKKYGFDNSQPLHIWKETGELLDGHTRRQAALQCGLSSVPVYEHSFSSMEEALEYTLGLQTARRNLTDSELLTALEKLDKLKNKGRGNNNGEPKGKSATHLADLLDTSTSKIEKARFVNKNATEDIKKAVAAGELTLNAATEIIKQEKSIVKNSTTLFSKIKKMNVTELATFLEGIQLQISKEEWEKLLKNEA